MTDITLTELERLGAFDEAERTFQMNEEAFREFYDQTSRPVWLYLARLTGDRRLADDLLQDTYYRFLRGRGSFESDEHRRRYLFRIATNLVQDHRRRGKLPESPLAADDARAPRQRDAGDHIAHRIDVARALEQLKPRERSLLWLAYAQGWSHDEIASMLGLKTASLKSLLHRARRRLATVLGNGRPAGGRT